MSDATAPPAVTLLQDGEKWTMVELAARNMALAAAALAPGLNIMASNVMIAGDTPTRAGNIQGLETYKSGRMSASNTHNDTDRNFSDERRPCAFPTRGGSLQSCATSVLSTPLSSAALSRPR